MTYKPTCVSRAGGALIRGDVTPLVDLLSAPGIDTDDHNAIHKRTSDWDADDRGYADKGGTNFLLPTKLPVNPPATDAALIQLINIPKNIPLADKFGDGGFALKIDSGILWNKGESWQLKWIWPTAVGSMEDSKAYSMSTGADGTYHFIDGYECSDSKGRNVTRIPIRVFSLDPFPQGVVTDKTPVSYMRDQHGVAWAVLRTNRDRTAVAVTDWSWVTTNKLGKANFQDSDITGVTAGESETTYDVSLIATLSNDPNIHIGDTVLWTYDEDGNKVAVSGYLDSKINSIEKWGGTTSNIKAGWTEYTLSAGYYAVNYKAGDADYGTPGDTLGSHPIQPREHSASVNGGTYAPNSWIEADWNLTDHPQTTSSENSISLTVATHPEQTCSENSISLTIANHNPHRHNYGTQASVVDEVGGVGTPGGEVTTSTVSPGGEHTHEHTFSIATGEVWRDDPSDYEVTVLTHSVTNSPHSHTCSPMTHSVTNSPHNHTSSPLAHLGTLTHRQEDFRPPTRVEIEIIRVSPDDE